MLKRYTGCAAAIILAFLPWICQASSGNVHALSYYGKPKYSKDFKSFDYVNINAPKGGEIAFSVVGTFDSLNPFIIAGTPAAGMYPLSSSYLHATLLEHAADDPFSAYGYIAESMEVAADHSWVIFHIRKEAAFHDGSPVRADDVIYTFNLLKEKGSPIYKSYYKDIREVEKINDLSVRFVFSSSKNRELPMIVGEMPVLQEKFYRTRDFGKADLSVPVGSGPYRVARVVPGRSIVYERIPGWWGEKLAINRGRYNFDRIRYEYFRDETVSFEAFKTGNIDIRIEYIARNWASGYNFPLFRSGKIIREELVFRNPQPMMGFLFNTRREIFHDRSVRQALGYCFDFEWANRNLFHGFYERSNSYFAGSDMAATGLPDRDEMKILEPFRGKIPEEVFTKVFQAPKTDGSGNIRHHLIEARRLLKEAGYGLQDGKMVHQKTGKVLEFDILLAQPAMERMLQGFVINLKKLGVQANIRLSDSSLLESRVLNHDFDMIVAGFPQSLTPGNEQRDFWGSSQASVKGSRNYAGISDPVVDYVIEKLILAKTREELVACTKALDRLLLWGHYLVPGYYGKATWVAFSSSLKHPEKTPPYRLDLNSWWVDEDTRKK